MAELAFDSEAANALTSLENDPTQTVLLGRVNAALDMLEQDPGQSPLRRHRFTNGIWCVVVAGPDQALALLWEPHPDEPETVIVQYLGSASFA